jgi:GntR family transcriptional regulator
MARDAGMHENLYRKPLYLQVRDAVAERIATAQFKPGAALPNEVDLAREFGVSAGTMRKALDLLESQHLLDRRQGRGTFVTDQSSAELAIRFSNIRSVAGDRISGDITSSHMTEGAATAAECARLELARNALVYRIDRVRAYIGRPFMVERATLPASLFPGLPSRKGPSHRIVVLAQFYGLLLGSASEAVSMRRPSPGAAKVLGDRSASLLVLDRIVRAIDRRPAEWRIAECSLGELQYIAEMQ